MPVNSSETVANVVTTSESLVVASTKTLENKEKLLKERSKKSRADKIVENGITFDFNSPF